jgi:hypothetical protein
MPRQPTGKPNGRPKKELAESTEKFWKEFDRLVSYQCSQIEIANFFNCSVDTLDRRCRDERGESFADVLDKRKVMGRLKVRKAQFEIMEQGNATLAIYLGKHLLGQSETPFDRLIAFCTERSITQDVAIEMLKGTIKALVPEKKTFEQFVADAGYPRPFPKQIEMGDFCLGGIITEPRMLLGSRGVGKTDYITILRVAYKVYLLGVNYSCLIITKEKKRAAAIIYEISQALIKNGVELEKSNSNCVRVKGRLGKDHSVEAISVKASMRGRHPDEALMDDPVTEEDVSQAMRDLVERKYNELLKLTKNVCIIGQPAHKQDLYAKLRPLLKLMEVPHGSIPELDHDLEAMKLAGVDERSIEMSYHLRIPVDGTNPFDAIRYVDKFPLGGDAVAWVDPAFKGTGKDTTALTIVKGHFDGIAVYGKVWQKAWNHCLDDMLPHLVRCGVKKLAVECNSLGDQPVVLFRQLFASKGLSIGVVGRDSIKEKHGKIMNAGTYAHLIHLSKESDRAYTNQVVNYEYGAEPDDAPDSLASCMEWIGLIRGKR